MNTSYTLLLSTLFAKRRHLVHGIIRSGEILGLITIPEVIKGYFSYHGNYASMFYTTSTFILLVISLFIAIPYPFELKLFDDDNEPFGNRNIEQLNARLAAFNFRLYDEKYPWVNYPTVNQTIGIRRSYLVLLTKKTQRTKRMPDLREEIRDKKTDDCPITQNFTNYFSKPSPSGIRPLYRDDIHFEGNINLFFSLTEKQAILDYHKSVSRLITVEDIYRPYRKAIWQVTKDPIRRSILIVFDVRGIEFMTYVILLGVDGIVNFVFNAVLTSYLMLTDKIYMHTTHDSFMLICLGLLLGQFIGYNWWEKEAINVSYNVSFLCVFASGLAIQSNVQSRYKIVKILSLLIYGLFTELFYCSMKSIYCYRINKMRSTQFHTYVTLVRGIASAISLMWIGKMIQPIVNTKEITSFGSKTLLCNAFFLFFGHMYLDYRKIKS
ncbi:uncharacterized protein LOC126904997 [Daktulosphaira vitifoliae]|uniref:uncharacterized protein LOC126904997 n=1 Tax=Daktulosphaira vitifoliae TaxID=58002 RepID=UPI0021A9A93F|nr:uncharacterized protein LOC126904997 [Daktulosphaira vitifoliae]